MHPRRNERQSMIFFTPTGRMPIRSSSNVTGCIGWGQVFRSQHFVKKLSLPVCPNQGPYFPEDWLTPNSQTFKVRSTYSAELQKPHLVGLTIKSEGVPAMYQSGSISSPGTCTQGKLLQYVAGLDADQTIFPQQERVVAQCGAPSILTGLDGGLYLFVAGQADHPSSPSCAPWPLSPLCLQLRPEARAFDLTRLPDMVDGIKRYVSGIPSAVMNHNTMLVYFNGGQLLEYQRKPETGWSVSAIPVPNIVVDANPVATLAGGSVFVVSALRGEALLLCKRDLQTARWCFVDLGAAASVCSLAGDPAVTEFRGKLHVFVCAAFAARRSPVQDAFELWDFLVDLDGSVLEAISISAIAGSREGAVSVRVTGSPSAVASHHRLQVFVRSDAGRLVEFRSTDGQQWESLPVSQGEIGGNAGAVFSGGEDSVVYASDPIGYLTEFREIGGVWQERRISRICGEADRWPRPVVCGRQVRIFDLDVAV